MDTEDTGQQAQPPRAEDWEGEEDGDEESDDVRSEPEDAPDRGDNHIRPILDPDSSAILPEFQILPLPSSQQLRLTTSQATQTAATAQLQLEIGQANDSLHKLRLSIGHKSFLYRHRVRQAPNYNMRTRSWDSVRSLESTVSYNANIYKACREAMVALGADNATLRKYKELSREDLKTDTAIMCANEPGHRNDRMSWIWHIRNPEAQGNPTWLNERMYSHLHSILPLNLVFYLVYRVNFLHARAQKERFHEEKVILESEILWTELSFKNRALIWKQRDMGGRSGLDCYARRQTALWDSMVEHAKEGARTMARSRDVFERGLVETT